jgi:phosphoglycerate dehydrogenase-like enzyme
VAELAVTLMLDVLRNVVPMAARLKEGEWAREQFSPRSYLLHGKTVGLVGIGNIAKKVAAIVRGGFNCQVLYYDVFRLTPEQEENLGVTYADLDELMTRSDIVSVHVPLLDSTAGMINKSKLDLMKPTACIINTSRGGVINEPDLIDAMQAGKILGAGLDTYAIEPLPKDSPLLSMENVVTTPHCGGNTVDNDINMATICMENIACYDANHDKTMRAIVNQKYLV